MDVILSQPDLTEHVFRSVRGWLHSMFPKADIHIQRSEENAKVRPAFRIEVAAGPGWEEANQGWGWLTMSVVVNYAAQLGEGAIFDAQRTAGKIVANAMPPRGRIPLNLYNFDWPEPPKVTQIDAVGGALPIEVDVAIAGVAADGSASGPSSRLSLAIPPDAVLGVEGTNWPATGPLAVAFRVYTAQPKDKLRLQGLIEPGEVLRLDQLTVFGEHPLTNQRMSWRGLRVESADTNLIEGSAAERQFDVAVTLRLRALVPRAWGASMDADLLA